MSAVVPAALCWMTGTLTANGDLEAPELIWDLDVPVIPC
jgi:hypothetical protein